MRATQAGEITRMRSIAKRPTVIKTLADKRAICSIFSLWVLNEWFGFSQKFGSCWTRTESANQRLVISESLGSIREPERKFVLKESNLCRFSWTKAATRKGLDNLEKQDLCFGGLKFETVAMHWMRFECIKTVSSATLCQSYCLCASLESRFVLGASGSLWPTMWTVARRFLFKTRFFYLDKIN